MIDLITLAFQIQCAPYTNPMLVAPCTIIWRVNTQEIDLRNISAGMDDCVLVMWLNRSFPLLLFPTFFQAIGSYITTLNYLSTAPLKCWHLPWKQEAQLSQITHCCQAKAVGNSHNNAMLGQSFFKGIMGSLNGHHKVFLRPGRI